MVFFRDASFRIRKSSNLLEVGIDLDLCQIAEVQDDSGALQIIEAHVTYVFLRHPCLAKCPSGLVVENCSCNTFTQQHEKALHMPYLLMSLPKGTSYTVIW